LGNANAGGAVTCKPYNSENMKKIMKIYFIIVFWKGFEISYKNM